MQAAIFLFLKQTAAFHLPYSINLSPTWNVLFYHYCMYRRFTDPKFFRRLPYRRIVVYNVIGYGHCPLFDILLQGVPPEYVFYSICKGMREYVWTNLLAGYFFILFQSPASLFPTFLPYCHIPFLFTSASSFADLNLCFRKSSLSPSS